MDRLRVFPAMNGSGSVGPGEDGATGLRSLALAGSLAAAVMAYQVCQPVTAHSAWLSVLILRSVWYVGLTTIAGGAGVWAGWLMLTAKPDFTPAWLSRRMSVGWIFLPCITLLYHRNSVVMLLFVAFTMLVIALSLRGLSPAADTAPQRSMPAWAKELPSLCGLPPADSRPMRSVWLAICAQGTLLLACKGDLFLASLPLGAGIFLFTWQWSAADPSLAQRLTGRVPSAVLTASAVFLTVFLLLPAFPGTWEMPGPRGGSHDAAAARRPDESDSRFGYAGIVLLPPVKKTEKLPQVPSVRSLMPGAKAQPILIPFDGAYWYFREPLQRPGPHAHLARGTPDKLNVHSTDSAALKMEAHQSLGLPIELECCGEVDVALTNADNRQGEIAVGVYLTDSTATGHPAIYLGQQVIESSRNTAVVAVRPPVKETLHFTIPRAAKIDRFDQITVVFLPGPTRARLGARVSLEGFELGPR